MLQSSYKKGTNIMEAIHHNIYMYRKQNNMTLEELGKRIGTSKQTIKRYETGEIKSIPYDKIVALANVFGITPQKLMGWEEPGEVKEKTIELSIEEIGHVVDHVYASGKDRLFIESYLAMDESQKEVIRQLLKLTNPNIEL